VKRFRVAGCASTPAGWSASGTERVLRDFGEVSTPADQLVSTTRRASRKSTFAPAQRQQLAHPESREGGHDEDRRVLLIAAVALRVLLGRDGGTRRVAVEAGPGGAYERRTSSGS